MAEKLPRILFESDDASGKWRIVRVQIDPKQRDPNDPSDQGIRDWIETTDKKDLLGNWRWRQVDKESEGVAGLIRLCHALKRELLARMEKDNA